MSKIDILPIHSIIKGMEQRNISITKELLAHAQAMVETGQYANVSDYMRALIRKDKQREEASAWLRQMHQEAVESGPPVVMSAEEAGKFIRRGIDRAKKQQANKKAG